MSIFLYFHCIAWLSFAGTIVKVTAKKAGKSVKKTLTFKATVKPSAKVTYTSSDDAIATVDANGSVKGVKAGTVTIIATAKVGTKTVKATKDIVVKNGITEFKATTPKKLTVKFAGEVTLTKDNFTVIGENNAKVAVKSVAFDATKTIATVELYSALTTGKKYTVTVKNGADTYTADVDFVRGEVAKIEAADQSILADGNAHAIKYTVYDENGLDVTDDTFVTFESNVAITNGQINLANGVMAVVTVVYTNPKTGAQIKSNTFKVTGAQRVAATVDAINVVDSAKQAANAKAWPTTVNTTIAKDDTTNNMIQVLYTDNFGEKQVTAGAADIVSLDPNVLVVNKATGKITTVAEGTAQIKVTINGKEAYFTITVTAKLKATSLKLDDASVLKASLTNASANNASVIVNVLNQNGNKFNTGLNVTFKLLSGTGVTANGTALTANTATDSITVAAGTAVAVNASTAGTAVFQVSSNGVSAIIANVTIYAADPVVTGYSIAGVKASMNINDKYDNDVNTTSNTTTVSVQAVNKDGFIVGGASNNAVSGAAITVKKGNETIATTTGASLVIDAEQLRGEGDYTIIATKGGSTIATANFSVKDTGVKPVITFKADSFAQGTTLANMFDVPTDWRVTGVYFASTNETILTSSIDANNNNGVTSFTLSGTTGNGQIANVVAVVTGPQSRTYKIAVTDM